MILRYQISLFSFVLVVMLFSFSAEAACVVRGKVYDAAEPDKGLAGIDIQIEWANQSQQKVISNTKGEYLVQVDAKVGTTVHASYGGAGFGTLQTDFTFESDEVEKNVGLVRPRSDDQTYWSKFIGNSSLGSDRSVAWQKAAALGVSAIAKISLSKELLKTTPEAVIKYPEIKAYSAVKLSDAKLLDALVQSTLDQKNQVPTRQQVLDQEPALKALPDYVCADVFADHLKNKGQAEQATNLEFIRASWGPDVQNKTREGIAALVAAGVSEPTKLVDTSHTVRLQINCWGDQVGWHFSRYNGPLTSEPIMGSIPPTGFHFGKSNFTKIMSMDDDTRRMQRNERVDKTFQITGPGVYILDFSDWDADARIEAALTIDGELRFSTSSAGVPRSQASNLKNWHTTWGRDCRQIDDREIAIKVD
jgi:hypothetical protein